MLRDAYAIGRRIIVVEIFHLDAVPGSGYEVAQTLRKEEEEGRTYHFRLWKVSCMAGR